MRGPRTALLRSHVQDPGEKESPPEERLVIPRRPKEYRISEYEVYAGIKGSILGTFNPSENKLYKEIKDLNKGLSAPQAKVLDKMLQKFCVKIDRKKNKLWSMPIDSEAIQNSYVRAKSREKQAQVSRELTRADIRKAASSSSPDRQSFFDYSLKGISQFERLAKSARPLVHPIVSVFDGKSREVLSSYRRGDLGAAEAIYDEYPGERVDEKEFTHEKLERAKELKVLRQRVAEVRACKRPAPRKPLISNLS